MSSANLGIINVSYADRIHYMDSDTIQIQLSLAFRKPKEAIRKNKHGFTILHLLAYHMRTEILDHKYVSKVKDNEGNTPLHILAMRGKTRIYRHKDVCRVKNNNGDTPLHLLAYFSPNGAESVLVIDNPDSIKVKNKQKKTPIDILLDAKNPMVIEHKDLIKPLNWRGMTLLHKLAAHGYDAVANHPMAHLIIEYKYGYTPLHLLAMAGHISAIENKFSRDVLDFNEMSPFDYYAFGDEHKLRCN